MRPLYSYFTAREETDKGEGRLRVYVRAYVCGYLHVRACARARVRVYVRVWEPACFGAEWSSGFYMSWLFMDGNPIVTRNG